MSKVEPLEEQWADIEGFPRYQVSNYGEVANKKTGRVLELTPSFKGYPMVTLCCDENYKSKHYVRRLVAKAFLPDFDEEHIVQLQSKDKTDNSVGNLKMGRKYSRKRVKK